LRARVLKKNEWKWKKIKKITVEWGRLFDSVRAHQGIKVRCLKVYELTDIAILCTAGRRLD